MPQLFLLMPFSWSPFWTSFWQKFPIWPMPVSWCSSFLTRFLAVSGWNPPHDHPLIFDQVGIVPCDHVMMVIRLKQWFFGDKKNNKKPRNIRHFHPFPITNVHLPMIQHWLLGRLLDPGTSLCPLGFHHNRRPSELPDPRRPPGQIRESIHRRAFAPVPWLLRFMWCFHTP